MTHQIKVKYLGNLRTKATHIKSNNTIVTDAPIDNNGKGEAFSPTDLFVSSLASCMITIMGIVSKTSGFEIGELKADVRKVMASNPRRISEVYIDFHFQNAFTEKEKSILERAAKHCPVGKSINDNIKEVISFHYKD